jgi:hypothetical protein
LQAEQAKNTSITPVSYASSAVVAPGALNDVCHDAASPGLDAAATIDPWAAAASRARQVDTALPAAPLAPSAGGGSSVPAKGAAGNGQGPKKSITEMLNAFRMETLGTVQQNLQVMQSELVKRMESLFTEYDASIKSHLNIIDSDLIDLREKYDHAMADNRKLWAAIEKIQADLVTANSVIPMREVIASENFDRTSLPNKLLLSCAELVDLDALVEAISPWLRNCGIDESMYKIVPGDCTDPNRRAAAPGLSYKWSLFFLGAAQLSERRAVKCNSSLRLEDGTWERIFVHTPAARQVRLFISPDKSHKQLATSGLSKKLKEALDATLVGNLAVHSSHLLRWEGIITLDWIQLAKVDPISYTEHRVLWSNSAIAKFGIDKKLVLEKFDSLLAASGKGDGKGKKGTGKRGGTEWSL